MLINVTRANKERTVLCSRRSRGQITNNLLEWTVGVDNTTGMVKDNFIQYFGSKQAMSA